MVKNMDKHWTATSLAAESQDYIDRIGPGDIENHAFMAQPKTEKKPKKRGTEADLERLREKVKDQICREYSQTGQCKYGKNCFRRHQEKAYYATTQTGRGALPTFDQF